MNACGTTPRSIRLDDPFAARSSDHSVAFACARGMRRDSEAMPAAKVVRTGCVDPLRRMRPA
ncbi:hypothetical protein WS45_22305 [Burkholderia sp. RF2-non_BP3]|nr:hypothetical protein WS45_22305 [Burkholderia sp. RF2-non_BP3]